jgi:CMP-2-keto-3-deoxyoctulosonic acid synthetase
MTQATAPAAPPFIAVVPARLASTRLPNKPLADIGGKPMVVRVAERALASGAQQVLIASDAQAVLDVAREHGIEAMLTRADHPSGTDRLAEVAAHFGWSNDTIVVNVQGDEPLIDPALVCGVASHLAASHGCAIATAAHPITDPAEIFNPNVVKVVLDSLGPRRVPAALAGDRLNARPACSSNGLSAYRTVRIPCRISALLPQSHSLADRAGRGARATARHVARRADCGARH